MNEFLIKKLSHLLRVGVIRMHEEQIFLYRSNDEYNPIYVSEPLRAQLLHKMGDKKDPFIYQDEYKICYGVIKNEDDFYFIGPMSLEHLNVLSKRAYYRKWNMSEGFEKGIGKISLPEFLEMVTTFSNLIMGKEYSEDELVRINGLTEKNRERLDKEKELYFIEENEREEYRHTYQEEKDLLELVRNGDVEGAIKQVRAIDYDVGFLGNDVMTHWKNLLVIGVTLCARAAIEGGVSPLEAYRVSGFYIRKSCECTNYADVLVYRDQGVQNLAELVAKVKARKHTSNYTLQCVDYIHKHFKEKISLEELADNIGVSASYLSRLFKREMGICLQDYVTNVKIECAANMLKYSDKSIAIIAEYVGFPTQSYMGKVFKKRMNLTPKQYRDYNKPAEFREKRRE